MTLAILQPVLIPDLSDLWLMFASDRVVCQDTEPWSRKGRTHRAKIRTPQGTQYLNVPVQKSDRKKPIGEVRIDHSVNWAGPILKALEFNYRNSVYYDFYEPEISADFDAAENYEYLIDFGACLRERILKFLEVELDTQIFFASEMPGYSSDPDILADTIGAGRYYQEQGSQHYQRQGKRKAQPGFSHLVYRQHFEGFEPGCCLLDLLFQYGPESFRILDKLKRNR